MQFSFACRVTQLTPRVLSTTDTSLPPSQVENPDAHAIANLNEDMIETVVHRILFTLKTTDYSVGRQGRKEFVLLRPTNLPRFLPLAFLSFDQEFVQLDHLFPSCSEKPESFYSGQYCQVLFQLLEGEPPLLFYHLKWTRRLGTADGLLADAAVSSKMKAAAADRRLPLQEVAAFVGSVAGAGVGCSVDDLQAAFACADCTAADRRMAFAGFGCSAADLQRAFAGIGCSVADLQATFSGVGCGVANLQMTFSGVGCSAADLQRAFAGVDRSVADLQMAFADVDCSVADLQMAFAGVDCSVADLQMAFAGVGYSVADLRMVFAVVGCSTADLQMAFAFVGCSAADLQMAFAVVGCTVADLQATFAGVGPAVDAGEVAASAAAAAAAG